MTAAARSVNRDYLDVQKGTQKMGFKKIRVSELEVVGRFRVEMDT
jgi:hypothetical protein